MTAEERVTKAVYAIRHMMGTHCYNMADLLAILEDQAISGHCWHQLHTHCNGTNCQCNCHQKES